MTLKSSTSGGVVAKAARRAAWGLACSLLLVASGRAEAQTHQGVELVEARLIADAETVTPGRPVTIGLYLRMAPGWHTYWEYPGDSGLATTLALELPEGFRATALQWPIPRRLSEPGGLEVYAYKDEVLLMTRLFPPADLDVQEIEIRGLAEWLVCEKICLPGEARLALKLEVADATRPANAELFQRFQRQLPQPLRGRAAEGLTLNWERQRQQLVLHVSGPEDRNFDFYPLPADDVVLGHPQSAPGQTASPARIRIPVASGPAGLTRVPGVLVVEDPATGDREGWLIP